MYRLAANQTPHTGCLSVLSLSTPPIIRTEKELSDKVQLLEVSRVCPGGSQTQPAFLHIDSLSHSLRRWETLKSPLSW